MSDAHTRFLDVNDGEAMLQPFFLDSNYGASGHCAPYRTLHSRHEIQSTLRPQCMLQLIEQADLVFRCVH